MKHRFDRRLFIGLLVAGAAAVAVPTLVHVAGDDVTGDGDDTPRPAPGRAFLTAPEVAFLTAAMERILPSDELGPGAVEAGGIVFLDRQLAGGYGHDVRNFRPGPYGAYTPYQGFQLDLTTAQVYRIAIAATDAYCRTKHGAIFADMAPAAQDALLKQLLDVADKIDLAEVPGAMFAKMLIQDTRDSFFADPVYGGNKNMVGWKFANYPGAFAGFLDSIFQHNVPYVSPPPQGMGDVKAMPPMDNR